MKKLFENVDGNQFRVAEFSSIERTQKPSDGDVIKEFLEAMAGMSVDEPPPLQVWEVAVSGAKTALQIYLKRNK